MTRAQKPGFTLTESIVAVVILSIAVPSMLWAVRGAHRDRIAPILACRARWLASERLEDIIADRHSRTRGYSYLTAVHYPAEGAIAGFPGFTRSTALSETTADLVTSGAGYMRATVTVSWTDSGVVRSLALATVLTDYTP